MNQIPGILFLLRPPNDISYELESIQEIIRETVETVNIAPIFRLFSGARVVDRITGSSDGPAHKSCHYSGRVARVKSVEQALS